MHKLLRPGVKKDRVDAVLQGEEVKDIVMRMIAEGRAIVDAVVGKGYGEYGYSSL